MVRKLQEKLLKLWCSLILINCLEDGEQFGIVERSNSMSGADHVAHVGIKIIRSAELLPGTE